MDVNGVMSSYNMSSVWNSINPLNSSSGSTVPLVSNIDSSIKENYTAEDYFGGTASSELQEIYKQIEPDYGIPLTYDQNGNVSAASSSLTTDNSNILSLLNSGNSDTDNLTESILNNYTAIENGTYKESINTLV